MSVLRFHSYWRSSAAYRVRIALNLKGIAYEQVGHDLRTGEQRAPAYLDIVPAGLVPAVQHDGQALSQSLAIIEWLDERWPDPPLLPAAADDRAVVRAMALTIAADVHPLNNLRVLKYVKNELGQEQAAIDRWVAHWIANGFEALETMVARHGAGFAFGSAPTLADCLVVPQVFNAERFGVDLAPYPQLREAAARAAALPAFAAAHPARQPDADPA